jgi:ABC-type Mn2+/Zn2+ transport system permease subunit
VVGTVLARLIHRDTGPVIIAIAATVFFVSLLARKE